MAVTQPTPTLTGRPGRLCVMESGLPGVIDPNGRCIPLRPIIRKLEGGLGSGIPDVFAGLRGLVIRIAIGALGGSLIIVGAIMIAGDVSLSQAANRFGSQIGSALRKGES